jgi:hypothetical protein
MLLNQLVDDARKLEKKNWRNVARSKDGWQNLLKKAWAQTGAGVPMMVMMIP